MSVLDRGALQESPLADLHAIASELSVDGYRRLRRPALIDAIIAHQSGEEPAAAGSEAGAEAGRPDERPAGAEAEAAGEAEADADAAADEAAAAATAETTDGAAADGDDESAAPRRRRGRRGGRGRAAAREETETEGEATGTSAEQDAAPASADSAPRRRRARSAGRAGSDEESTAGVDTSAAHEADAGDTGDTGEDQPVEGVVELLPNGSGFVRVAPPDPSDDDVYISAAQVKRCELVSGDRIAGPKRAPRRSERFASLIRVETINGRPASELADSVRFDDLPAAFPSRALISDGDDPALAAVHALAPIGRGSRVTIVGPARSGKTELLRRLATALAHHEDLTLSIVLAGARPEEITEWNAQQPTPTAAVGLAASEDARDGVIEPAIDQARRLAARGADAVVVIDTLDGVGHALARKTLAAARNIVDGGSVTVIATAARPVGGETTVIALDPALAQAGRFPALDPALSGTMRPELLVGEAAVSAGEPDAG